MTAARATSGTGKPDSIGAKAVDDARDALVAQVGEAEVGDHLGVEAEDERVVTHYFACTSTGYRGWRWAVTVARAPRLKTVTIDEVVLLPGDTSIVAPVWLPYKERLQPGDLSPGDLLPADEDDARLVPGWLSSSEDNEIIDEAEGGDLRRLNDEVGLGRERVLSLEGRYQAAERWYDGDRGPDSPLAQSAPAPCGSCGFLVRLAGPLSTLFGVCANAFANDDGGVVSLDHGCGAHSGARLGKSSQPQPLPDPVLDTLTWDELETF